MHFNTDSEGHARNFDPTRSNFLAAERVALNNALADPNLTEVPEWAMHGGLRPAARSAGENDDTISFGPPEERASNFILTKDDLAHVIAEEPTVDPFATIVPVSSFHPSDRLFWAAQYCNGTEKKPELIYTLELTSVGREAKITRTSEPSLIAPDHIKASAGCFLLRGEITISENPPGQYELELMIADPNKGNTATFTRRLRIEK